MACAQTKLCLLGAALVLWGAYISIHWPLALPVPEQGAQPLIKDTPLILSTRAELSEMDAATHVYDDGSLILTSLPGMRHHVLRCFESRHDVAVLSVINEPVTISFENVTRLHINVIDKPSTDLLQYFEAATHFIHEQRAQGRVVIVHCRAGISRSATLVLAYLMRYENWDLIQAYDYLHARRPIIWPNSGFWAQLRPWEVQNKLPREHV